jgi:hypothetical protein
MSAFRPRTLDWADLPLDLLADVSGRLHDVADFVRFHAICRPWRDLQLHSPTVGRTFPPWLLRSYKGLILLSVVNFGGDATSSSYRHDCNDIILAKPPGASSTGDTNWVTSADGTAAWIFTWSPVPGLIDLLTGAVTPLPLFPCDDEIRRLMKNPHGVVYSDGTLMLYSFVPEAADMRVSVFTAAILRAGGDVAWMYGTKRLVMPTNRYLSVAYHDGKMVLYMHRR